MSLPGSCLPACRYTWLDRDDCSLVQINMINMDTGRAEEAYPHGFWHNVVEVRVGTGPAG